MHNAKMLMEMQHHTKPMQQMHEDVPTITTPTDYTGKTHFTAEEVKASWVPKVSLSSSSFPSDLCETLLTQKMCHFTPWQDQEMWNEDGNADTAFDIASGINNTSYLNATLIKFAVVATVLWFSIRKAFSTGLLAAARGVNDIGISTLIILGGIGTCTGFHLDWTQAYNIAISVGTAVAANTVLSVWTFINPLLIDEADEWVKQNLLVTQSPPKKKARGHQQQSRWPLGFVSSSDDRVHLKGDDLARFVAYMQQLGTDKGIANPVVQLQQKTGQLVYVPAGWAHQVVNFSPSVKVAWDYYDAGNFHKYAQLQHRIASKFFKQGMAKDYMSFNMVMQELASK